MFTVVVFEITTRKVILCLPLEFKDNCYVTQKDAILHNGYDFEVFADREPVFYENADGDVCLKKNSYIIKLGDDG